MRFRSRRRDAEQQQADQSNTSRRNLTKDDNYMPLPSLPSTTLSGLYMKNTAGIAIYNNTARSLPAIVATPFLRGHCTNPRISIVWTILPVSPRDFSNPTSLYRPPILPSSGAPEVSSVPSTIGRKIARHDRNLLSPPKSTMIPGTQDTKQKQAQQLESINNAKDCTFDRKENEFSSRSRESANLNCTPFTNTEQALPRRTLDPGRVLTRPRLNGNREHTHTRKLNNYIAEKRGD